MKAWWNRLQPRERILLGAAAAVVALTLLWILVWEPLNASRQALRDELAAQQALLDWLERIEPQVEQLRREDRGGRSLDGRSPLAVVDQSARAAGLAAALKRIEPGAGGEIRVSFEQAAFVELMTWLETLIQTRPLVVVRFEASRGNQSGRVDSLVVLRLIGGG
jgi:general secretion pathway protein M